MSGVSSYVIPCRLNAMLQRSVLFLPIALFQPLASGQQPTEGTIVFAHAPDGRDPWPVTDIYSMGADGANVKALTSDGHSHTPAWSPDGRRILFIHDSALQTKPAYREEKGFESYHPVELSVMDRDGGNRHLLRRLERVVYSAAWSPDGKMLAITCFPGASASLAPSSEEPVRAGLFLLPADGQGEPRLLFRNGFTPAWSPDGKRLAFSVEKPRGLWAVHVANSDGSNDVQLTDPNLIGGSPAWSPDGKQIAFDEFADQRTRQQVFVMDIDGSHRRQITTDTNWSCEHPSWSSDGKQIAFSCRSASVPCGMGVSSVGTLLPACTRRIFTVSPGDAKSKPKQIHDHDGTSPEFAPIP